jgi:hypothetical protein
MDGRFAQGPPPLYPSSLLATPVSHKYPAQAALHAPRCWNLLCAGMCFTSFAEDHRMTSEIERGAAQEPQSWRAGVSAW